MEDELTRREWNLIKRLVDDRVTNQTIRLNEFTRDFNNLPTREQFEEHVKDHYDVAMYNRHRQGYPMIPFDEWKSQYYLLNLKYDELVTQIKTTKKRLEFEVKKLKKLAAKIEKLLVR